MQDKPVCKNNAEYDPAKATNLEYLIAIIAAIKKVCININV